MKISTEQYINAFNEAFITHNKKNDDKCFTLTEGQYRTNVKTITDCSKKPVRPPSGPKERR